MSDQKTLLEHMLLNRILSGEIRLNFGIHGKLVSYSYFNPISDELKALISSYTNPQTEITHLLCVDKRLSPKKPFEANFLDGMKVIRYELIEMPMEPEYYYWAVEVVFLTLCQSMLGLLTTILGNNDNTNTGRDTFSTDRSAAV